MAETIEQYMKRILGNVDQDPVAMMAGTKQRLEQAVSGVPAEKLKQRPAADKWSAAEIIAHLVDAEIVAAYRIRKIVAESGSTITAYEQDDWERNLHYMDRDPHESVKQFGVLRDMNLDVLRRVKGDQWERYGMHEERGKETLRQMIKMYAGHDVNHLRQIEGMLKGERSAA